MDFKRELRDIEVDEVSFVDNPANRRPFLFFKGRGAGKGVGKEPVGDGGADMCVCPECGYEEKHVRSGEGKSMPCTQIKCPICGARMQGSEEVKEMLEKKEFEIALEKFIDDTEVLAGLKDMDKVQELEEVYKSLTGEDLETEIIEKAKKLSDKARSAIKGALNLLNKYKEEMPDDLKKVVSVLAKYAVGKYPQPYPYKAGEGEKKGVEKKGRKISQATEDALRAIQNSIGKLLGDEDKDGSPKGDEKPEDAIEKELLKVMADIQKAMTGEDQRSSLPESPEDDADTLHEISKTLAVIGKRLEKLEKAGAESQQKDEGGEKGGEKKPLWPSFA